MSQEIPKRRKRGVVLTADGQQKLQTAIRQAEQTENFGEKYTLEDLSDRTGLDPSTIAKVLNAEDRVDRRTLERFFQTVASTLEEKDYVLSSHLATPRLDPNFIGRESAIADLDTLVQRDIKVIVIQARGGVGKTTLARRYLQQEFETILEFPIAKETKDIASVESLIEEKLRQIGEEPGREFLVSIDRLKRKLQRDRIGILIDNLEPALDSAGKFIELHRRYVELLRMLADPSVRSLTLVTSRERLHEPSVTVQNYLLRSLSTSAWEQFFQAQKLEVEMVALSSLHYAYGGNAKAMDLISRIIYQDYSGNVAAYWQENQDDLIIEQDLEDLVIDQFNRLQQIDANAYKLLYRLGCYRYQDVPTVSMEGVLCLLWDVPENQRKRTVKALQERSLVEIENGEFWLHPVIRREAIERLRVCEDWHTANQKAAEFWTNSVSIIISSEHALKALEAYHHYVEIEDFEQACLTLLKERIVKTVDTFELGRELVCNLSSSLLRLSLFQQAISTTGLIIDRVKAGCHLCHLYLALAEAYWFTGDVRQAILFNEKALELADEFNLIHTKIFSLINLGLCKEDLWEIEESMKLYSYAITLAESIGAKKFLVQAKYCLMCLHISLGNVEAVARLIEEVQKDLAFPIGIRSTGYRLYALGLAFNFLRIPDSAMEMYQQAVEYSVKINFIQLQAIVLVGMASHCRQERSFCKAHKLLSEARNLLDEIGAKRNLAETYYQIGLVYQDEGKVELSKTNFQESIKLFTEMKAPKQVERVKQSMN